MTFPSCVDFAGHPLTLVPNSRAKEMFRIPIAERVLASPRKQL
jgi:hypothetical protein